MTSLLGTKGGRIGLGLLCLGGAGVALLVPHSQDYSDYGFGNEGAVEVKCGSVVDDKISVVFDNYEEQLAYDAEVNNSYYGSTPYIFEGKSAEEVCKKELQSWRVGGIVAGVVGGILLLVGLATTSTMDRALHAASQAHSMRPPATRPPAPPPPPPARESIATAAASVAAAPPSLRAAPAVSSAPPAAPTPPLTAATSFALGQASVGGAPTTMPAAMVPRLPISVSAPKLMTSASYAAAPPHVDAAVIRAVGSDATIVRAKSRHVLVFDSGERVAFSDRLTIGRDPISADGHAVHRVADNSLSKSHLDVGVDLDGTAWVMDRTSKNGTEIQLLDGSMEVLTGGVRTNLSHGAVVLIGDTSFTVEDATS